MKDDEDVKSPEEYAKKQVNKKIGDQIASRLMKIKEHEAAIKKLNKEIEKIKNGELVDESSSSSCIRSNQIFKGSIYQPSTVIPSTGIGGGYSYTNCRK